MKRIAQIVILVLAFLICTGCLQWSVQTNAPPDRLLYDNAADAMQHGKYDVAAITLQTLINTYPDSGYSAKAKQLLQDPRLADVQLTSDGGMEFFPE